MAVRPLALVILVVGLVLAGCSPPLLPTLGDTPATAVAVPTGVAVTQQPAPSPAAPAEAPPPPPPTEGPPSTSPLPTPGTETGAAFRAWAIAPDGRFYLLQSSGSVRRHSSDMASVIDASAPLFAGQDPGRAHMAIGQNFLVLSSESLSRTLVLERESFAPVRQLDKAGPIAIDGSRQLFVLAEDAVWAYDLANASALPVAVTKWPVDPFTPRPGNLAVDEKGNQLLVTLHDISASPPHQQEWYAGYDLDTLQPLRSYPAQLGELARPSAGNGGIVAGMAAKNGFLGSKVAVFDREGNEVAAARPFDGKPIVDARGEYIYILRERGIWVLRASDLSLAAVSASVGDTYRDLLLSPDGASLYLVGDGVIAMKETAQLRGEGIAPLRGPLLPTWFDAGQTDFFRARFYPAPGTPDTAFVQVGGYGETWRSEDWGKTWRLLPGLVYPNFNYATHLSISPDFATDRTLVSVNFSSPVHLRSTDGGDTWSAWEPPVAFVSDRDGDLAIYTADRGRPGGGVATNVVRRSGVSGACQNPAWSPAWTRIAFQSNGNGNWDIFTIRAGCDPSSANLPAVCDLRQITDHPEDDMLPAWSPSGRWIAFVSTRDGNPDIYLTAPSGGPAYRLTNGSGGSWRPAWLPDSQHLLYTTSGSDGSNDIVRGRLATDADGAPSLAEVSAVVSTAADERDAAVAREYMVYLSNRDGIPRTYGQYNYDEATSFPFTPGTEPESHPAVLDDGQNTILVTLEREGGTGIYRANTSGYEAFVVDAPFDGQPGAGPVPWQPGADWSEERIREWQR